MINALRKKADLCGQLELAITEEDTYHISEIEQELRQIEITDKSLEKRFKSRFKAVRDTDKSAASQERRLLCIELEILLDVASPEEDRALRMQFN